MKTSVLFLCPLVIAACFKGGSGDGSQGPDASTVTQDGGPGGDGSVVPPGADAAGFVCNNDAELEPNDRPATATDTGIPNVDPAFRIVGLAICPSSDIDFFRFQVGANGADATVTLDYSTVNGSLNMAILNGTEGVIAAGMPLPGNQNILKASISNLPMGTYFAAVRADEGLENNYNLEIVTTP